MTIDDDLADSLKEQARQQHVPFKRVVNDALRRGLGQERNGQPPNRKIESSNIGPGLGIDEANLRHIEEDMLDQELIERFHRPKK